MKYVLRASGKTIDLTICDEIWSGSPCSAQYVRDALKAAPDATLIRVRINSIGGDVTEGLDIYQSLSDHPARVEGYVTGLAASIASVILCACDYVRMAAGAQIMIHNPYAGVQGDAAKHRTAADHLERATQALAEIYVAKTGQTSEWVLASMQKETYLDAQSAKTLGFADEIIKAKTAPRELATLDLSALRAPDELVRMVAKAKETIMDPQICEALGLPADASLEDVMKALTALKEAGKPAPAPKEPAAPAAVDPAPADDEMAAAVAGLDPKAQAKILGLHTKATALVTARLDKIEKERDERDLAALLPKVPTNLQAWARKQTVAVVREYVASLGETSVTEPALVAKKDEGYTETDRAVAKATGLSLAQIKKDRETVGSAA